MKEIKIYIEPQNVFEYFQNHKQDLEDKNKIVAESYYDDFDKKSYLYLANEKGTLFLSLEAPEVIVDSEFCYTRKETEYCVKEFLKELEKLSD